MAETEAEGRDALCWNVLNLSAKMRPNILNNVGEWRNIAYVSEIGYKKQSSQGWQGIADVLSCFTSEANTFALS